MNKEIIEEVREWITDLFSCGFESLGMWEAQAFWPQLSHDEWEKCTRGWFVSATGLTVFNRKPI